jgi:outer membrane protein OmpA-like peptidoglycan-associated protein
VLDKAYASSEVGSDGKARAVPPASPKAVARSVAVLAKVLPPKPRPDDDADGDKVVDRDDACDDRAGVKDPDPARNGCPRAVERVVVLPDADVHVGAIEVDDGKTVTVIDKPYATAEIGADGQVHAVETEPAKVAEQFVKAIEAQPAGARIILYFNSRAEPARDISAPIAAVVAEVQNKTTYTIEVVGHTDQVGSRTANRRIGRARAELIADRLVAAGIPRNRVRVISRGASDPAIPVKDRKTVELRNRRVEVFVRDSSARSR